MLPQQSNNFLNKFRSNLAFIKQHLLYSIDSWLGSTFTFDRPWNHWAASSENGIFEGKEKTGENKVANFPRTCIINRGRILGFKTYWSGKAKIFNIFIADVQTPSPAFLNPNHSATHFLPQPTIF